MSAKFNFGDIVAVTGYWPRVFKIDGYRNEECHYPNETYKETVYELIDAHSSVWIEADEDDLTIVARAEMADVYLANNPAPAGTEMEFEFDYSNLTFGGGTMNMAKQERQPTARELSAKEAEEKKAARKAKAEAINNLLDMRIWYADQFAKTADVEYCDRVFATDCELKKLMETD
jgi:hypothetical protein